MRGMVDPVVQSTHLEMIDLGAQSSREDIVAYACSVIKRCEGECREACPLGVDIPAVLEHVRAKDFQKARDALDEENPFPSLCGRCCSAPCQAACSCAVQFREVERFLGDMIEPTPVKVRPTRQHVAIVGAGISGLTVASFLSRQGIQARILEATDRAGGIMARALPAFRVPHKVVEQEVGRLSRTAKIIHHAMGGTTFPLEELAKQSQAVVIATGANKPAFLGIAGEHLKGVLSSVDFLSNLQKRSEDCTVVIGGVAQAIDAARYAKRLGDDVTVLFHKHSADMSAEEDNVLAAKKEGVKFMVLTKPSRMIGSDRVSGVECTQMMLEESETGEAKVAVPIEGSEFVIPCSKVIIAIGLEPNPTIGRYSTIRTVGKGRVWVNEHHQTNMPNVFAAGEIAIGSSRIEKTLAHAKSCARSVQQFLRGELKAEVE